MNCSKTDSEAKLVSTKVLRSSSRAGGPLVADPLQFLPRSLKLCYMGRVSRTIFVFVLVALAARILFAQREKPHPIHKQTLFSEDRPLQKPTPLPEDVLKLLLSTEEVSNGLAFANGSERKNPAKLFRVAEVHLSRPDQADLVVVGIPPMCGAD